MNPEIKQTLLETTTFICKFIIAPLITAAIGYYLHWKRFKLDEKRLKLEIQKLENQNKELIRKEQERSDKYKHILLEKRLEVHQKALSLWYKMGNTMSKGFGEGDDNFTKKRMETIIEIDDFWDNSCLYLLADVRKAFLIARNYYFNREFWVSYKEKAGEKFIEWQNFPNSSNNRSEFYDKWSQTINSMVDLIKETYFEIENANVPEYRFAFFPITVVPDDKLYFGKIEEGKEFIDTQKGNICFYQLNAEIKNVVRGYPLSIKNSIFCTFSGLKELLGVLVNSRA